jgi:hypothetical protein
VRGGRGGGSTEGEERGDFQGGHIERVLVRGSENYSPCLCSQQTD